MTTCDTQAALALERTSTHLTHAISILLAFLLQSHLQASLTYNLTPHMHTQVAQTPKPHSLTYMHRKENHNTNTSATHVMHSQAAQCT